MDYILSLFITKEEPVKIKKYTPNDFWELLTNGAPLIEKVDLYHSHTKLGWYIIRNQNILSESPFLIYRSDDKVCSILRIDSTGEFDLVGMLYSKPDGKCLDIQFRMKFTKNSLNDYDKKKHKFREVISIYYGPTCIDSIPFREYVYIY